MNKQVKSKFIYINTVCAYSKEMPHKIVKLERPKFPIRPKGILLWLNFPTLI